VASEAMPGDWLRPIKKKTSSAVEGRPAINPLRLLPDLFPAVIERNNQAVPVKNVSRSRNRKSGSIVCIRILSSCISAADEEYYRTRISEGEIESETESDPAEVRKSAEIDIRSGRVVFQLIVF